MAKWLKKAVKFPEPEPGLPDPNMQPTPEKALLCAAVNDAIVAAGASPRGEKRKRGSYGAYSGEDRFRIGKYGAEHETTAAAKHFSRVFERKLNESTVRGMVKAYKLQLTKKPSEAPEEEEEAKSLPAAKRGRKLYLGEDLDAKVVEHLKGIRQAGGVVNSTIIVATARGILGRHNMGLLAEHGGPLDLTKT